MLIAACQPIANMPVALRDEIDSAAQALSDASDDPSDARVEFAEVHCRADGDLLIVFEWRSGGATGMKATATSSGDERDPWTLDLGPEDLQGDITEFFAASPQTPCPPGPG